MSRYNNLQPDIWGEAFSLIAKYNAISCVGGTPGFPCEDFAKEALKSATDNDNNGYVPMNGDRRIVNMITHVYSQKLGRQLGPENVVATTGAAEAITAALLGLLDFDDEVIIFEPFYNFYDGFIATAGGKCVYVPLQLDTWEIDYTALAAAITDRTKVIIFNNPHNPTGKLYSQDQLRQFAQFLEAYPQITIVSDEVYECHIFNGKMIHFASILWDRTISVYSGGKLFSVTGWKTGWAIGPPNLMQKVHTARKFITTNGNSCAQVAIADMLRIAEGEYKGHTTYYEWLAADFKARAEMLHEILTTCSAFKATAPRLDAGYFLCVTVDTAFLDTNKYCSDGVTESHGFCRWLAEHHGVAALPVSAFCSQENAQLGRYTVRFNIGKSFDELEEIRRRLNAQFRK